MDRSEPARCDRPTVIEADAVPIERASEGRRNVRQPDDEITSFSPWVWVLLVAVASFKVFLAAVLFVVFVFKYPKLLFGGLGTLFGRASRAARNLVSDDPDDSRR